jgi:hypothetical protein
VVVGGLQQADATQTWNSGDTINGNGNTSVNLILNSGTASIVDANNIAAINVNLISDSALDATEFTNVAAVNITSGVAAKTMTVSNAQLATVFGAAVTGRAFTETITYSGTSGTADTANLSAAGTGSSTARSTFNVGSNDIEAVTLATSGSNYMTVNAGTAAATVTVSGSGTNDVVIGTTASALALNASATTGTNKFDLGTAFSTTDVITGGSGTDTLVAQLTSAVQINPTVTAVEKLDLTFTAAAIYNASKTTGVTTLTLTPFAGGINQVSAHLVISRIF